MCVCVCVCAGFVRKKVTLKMSKRDREDLSAANELDHQLDQHLLAQ